MAKPFKLRISRVITSLQSCNSKDTSTLPEDPVPSFLRQSSINPTKLNTTVGFPVTAPSNARRSSSAFKRHVSSAFLSVGCGFTSRSGSTYTSGDCCTARSRPQEFKWGKEENWHVVANIYDETKPRQKIYSSSVSDDAVDKVLALPPPPPPPPSTAEKKKRRARKKKTAAAALRISTSSADESGLFSNDEEETETLVSSSRSFSTDNSSVECNPTTGYNNRRRSKRKPKTRSAKRGTSTMRRPSVSSTTSSDDELPARLSVFKKLIPCSVDGKVKESFAIVKKSRDPHEDFKRSMMEMILEKQMFEKNDLEQLLQCFLSLNARQYHGIIVGAFSEIWEDLFCAANDVSSGPSGLRISAYRRRMA